MGQSGITIIDLRSDTVTKPSPAMRRQWRMPKSETMCFIEDPTLNRLQERAAEIFGREAALLFHPERWGTSYV